MREELVGMLITLAFLGYVLVIVCKNWEFCIRHIREWWSK